MNFFSWVGLGEASENRRPKKYGFERLFCGKAIVRRHKHFYCFKDRQTGLGQSVINIFVHSLDMNISVVFELLNIGEGRFL